MPLIFSFIAIGNFFLIAALIEVFIAQEPHFNKRISYKERQTK